jgi:hypothetical protein
MNTERFSLTCAPGGENHAGMEIIGRMPVAGEGLTCMDVEGLGKYFGCETYDLNALSGDEMIKGQNIENQGRVIILRNWLHSSKLVYKELTLDSWDAEYLDRNKYRVEVIDGVETRVRGRRMNKLARKNLCYVEGRSQEPAVMEGKGRIVDLCTKNELCSEVRRLGEEISEGLCAIGSESLVDINVVEGNRYYDLKKTGIGFHGDTERVMVICISVGCDDYPMCWQWFRDGMPVGECIDVKLNSGDVYIMSEKAVGTDWKKRTIPTVRHAAGAKKYRSRTKWEKRREGYNERLKARMERGSVKAAFAKCK